MIDTQLREAVRARIDAGDVTQIELSRRSGVPQPRISAFLAGNDLRLESAAKLAKALGLELRKAKRDR